MGVWTNMAVERTARETADPGYQVAVVSDATSSINVDWLRAVLTYALTNIATILTTAEVTAAPGESHPCVRSRGQRGDHSGIEFRRSSP